MTDETEEAPAAANAPSATEALIDKWFAESFSGSIVSQQTDIYNAVFAAKEDLKRRMATEG